MTREYQVDLSALWNEQAECQKYGGSFMSVMWNSSVQLAIAERLEALVEEMAYIRMSIASWALASTALSTQKGGRK